MCTKNLPTEKRKNRIQSLTDPETQSFFENLIMQFAALIAPREVFTEEEAAEYLRVEVKTIRYYALKTKELAYHTVGRSQVYTKLDLDAFLASRQVMSIGG